MPTCVSVNSSTDFTTSALSAPDDGFSFAIVQPTPTPTESPTPSPSESPTPTPTESPTPSPSESPTPTPSPSATSGGTVLPAGGADCDNPLTWPSSDNTKYQVTFTDTTTEWTYYYSGVDTKKLYMSVVGDPTTPVGGRVRVGRATDGTPPCLFDVYNNAAAASLLAGFDMSAAASGKFSIRAWDGATVSTWDIWIDN